MTSWGWWLLVTVLLLAASFTLMCQGDGLGMGALLLAVVTGVQANEEFERGKP